MICNQLQMKVWFYDVLDVHQKSCLLLNIIHHIHAFQMILPHQVRPGRGVGNKLSADLLFIDITVILKMSRYISLTKF